MTDDPTGPATGGPPPPDPPPPVDAAATAATRSRGIVSLVVAVALIAAAAGGAFVLTQGDDEGERDVAGESAGEIFLEPVAFRTPDPFTTSVDAHNDAASPTTVPVLPTLPAPEAQDAGAGTTSTTAAAVRTVSGATPGLYGGTRDNGACDAEQLIAFLADNPQKAAAWGGVLGVAVDAIPEYARSLTPVVLQRDTRVTNHGYRNGRATTLSSVLQAGTAVLVDDLGTPRVKCGCGNPLTEPTPSRGATTYTGQAWPGFAPANVIVVAPAPTPMVTIVLVDVSGGDPFERPIATAGAQDTVITADSLCDLYPEDEQCGAPSDVPDVDEEGLGTGDVQITLRWASTADLDLSVTDPTGFTINYDERASPSGGQLDVDSNGGCEGATAAPVENIFWPEGAAPDGDYLITVDYFDVCPGGEGNQAFTLTFSLGGVPVDVVPVRADGAGAAVTLLLHRGRAGFLPAVEVVQGMLEPGGSQQFRSSKGPGYEPPPPETPETPETPDTSAPPSTPGTTGTPESDGDPCAQYEEGTPMRTLCEHDPTTNDVSGEGDFAGRPPD